MSGRMKEGEELTVVASEPTKKKKKKGGGISAHAQRPAARSQRTGVT